MNQYYKAEMTREGMAYYPVDMPQELSESIAQAEQDAIKKVVDEIESRLPSHDDIQECLSSLKGINTLIKNILQ